MGTSRRLGAAQHVYHYYTFQTHGTRAGCLEPPAQSTLERPNFVLTDGLIRAQSKAARTVSTSCIQALRATGEMPPKARKPCASEG